MILTLFLIGFVLLLSGIIYYAKNHDNYHKYEEWICYTLNGVGGTIVGITLIVGLILGGFVSEEFIIDEKIALYEEENAVIQTQVAEVVEQYMEHEKTTYDKISPDSDPTLIVTIFPELKSNELVTKQIELYQSNAAQIKKLKSQKIDIKVQKWWLYFG